MLVAVVFMLVEKDQLNGEGVLLKDKKATAMFGDGTAENGDD